jgi:ATP citrate (pro-S)-lyase
MVSIAEIRKSVPHILVHGLHPGIIQSILDYDHLLGRDKPTIMAIVARGRKKERFFWGGSEVELSLYASIDAVPEEVRESITGVVNVQSARNVKDSIIDAIEKLPNLKVAEIFAEGTPEAHSLELITAVASKDVLILGPSSVGVLVPGVLKLGAIGGTMYDQLLDARIKDGGDVAVISTSGGMVNELIRVATGRGRKVSFAIAMGGDRFPVLDPEAAILLAENDPQTKEIIYFGELGGTDEYRIAELIKSGKVTKRVIVYIAGVVAELFDTPPQFGHAKALAENYDESASAKKEMLAGVGVVVADRFDDISSNLEPGELEEVAVMDDEVNSRRKAYFMSHLSGETNGTIQLLGDDLLKTVQGNSLASLTLSMLLGQKVSSPKLIEFTDLVLKLLVDHSPNVSGAVNTMITARAGKDLVSSLAAGLLTIGPRFGGAINDAAGTWLDGVGNELTPKQLIDIRTKATGIVPGIGHKKYSLDHPDPRVKALAGFGEKKGKYLAFARGVETITTTKKTNLILNVDGVIAAVMLDLLASELKYTSEKLRELVDIEFFNSLFVISRTVGFTAHYLDQRRNDEGLFRLDESDLQYFE